MKEFERTLKALANRRRLAVLRYLKREKEASVADIASAISLSFRSTSRHLAILYSVDILIKEQRSLHVFYRFSPRQTKVSRYIIDLL